MLAQVKARANDLRDGCDLLVSSYFNNLPAAEKEGLRLTLLTVFRDGVSISEKNRRVLPDLENLRPFHWELEFPEVFTEDSLFAIHNIPVSKKSKLANSLNGFDAIVGNPPFMGGKKITGALGTVYRDFIVKWLAKNKKGNADFCAYFFLKARHLLNQNGEFGLIATNTIAQGDTREVGLDQLIENCVIYRAVPSRKWPGSASLEVAYIWLKQGSWKGDFILDEQPVDGITPFLTNPGKASGNPYRLAANQDKSFQGSVVLGMGFVLTPEEAQALIEKDPKNQDVLFPYLNGEDLNSRPDQSPSRWVINFKDWPLDAEHDDPKKPKGKPYAIDYPDCLAIVKDKVKPERDKLGLKSDSSAKGYAKYWWLYGRRSLELYSAIADMEQVLIIPETTKFYNFIFSPTNIVFSHATRVLIFNKIQDFALLNSTLHTLWADLYSSTLETRLKYITSDCFETFPFPKSTANLEDTGDRYYNHRQNIMLTRQEGLTKTYNRFHNSNETAADIQELRQLHIEMDKAVATAYGYEDLSLDHDFHQTKQGVRFTICENARREILDRLLQLNHQRYAEEVAQGLHDKGKKKSKGGDKKKVKQESNDDTQQMEMF